MALITIVCIGDICGVTGRVMLQKYLPKIKALYTPECIIVNGENSADSGRGITSKIAESFFHAGVDVITTGNHIWHEREIYQYLSQTTQVIRPANFPRENPGVGFTIVERNNYKIAVVNIMGRVFMREHIDCPFRTIDTLLMYLKDKTSLIIIDIHAETTAEKIGFAWHVEGRVSAVVGTHTHVPTADERILPLGTAFVTDLGMVGAYNSMLGMKKEPIIKHFLTQMPVKFEVEKSGPAWLTGVAIKIDTATGRAHSIERIKIIDENLDI